MKTHETCCHVQGQDHILAQAVPQVEVADTAAEDCQEDFPDSNCTVTVVSDEDTSQGDHEIDGIVLEMDKQYYAESGNARKMRIQENRRT